MIVYSFKYIVAFLILFWVYWLLCKNKNSQNGLLLVASYVFYGLWDWRCLALLFATSMVAYGAGLYFKIERNGQKSFLGKSSRWWVSFGSIVFSLAILGYFKYANFFLLSISDLTGGGTSLLISFFLSVLAFILFQQLVILLTVTRRS